VNFEYQLLFALALDFAIGDPRWFPHPVRLIGRLAAWLETPTRRVLPPRAAGIVTVLATVGATAAATWGCIGAASLIHPIAGDVAKVLVLWTTLAARDLARHALDVGRALSAGDLPSARQRLGKIVGRDTETLDETEIVRGAVESVAENTMDGVTAPLFYACLFGPVGAMAYKAINTLDSTFGYRNPRYLYFGWASARLDDVAGFVPARLTAPIIAVAAALIGLRPIHSLRIFVRDRRKHPSPNSGLSEAAMAGAMGIQLGGLNYYFGQPSPKPTLGEPLVELTRKHIFQTIKLMFFTTALAATAFLGLRRVILYTLGVFL
jgi:adenosylcobinamide-phosphate synthase